MTREEIQRRREEIRQARWEALEREAEVNLKAMFWAGIFSVVTATFLLIIA